MKLRFLADANFNRKIVTGVLRQEMRVDFLTAGEVDLTGIPDLQVLALAASEGRVLLSHDIHTMPRIFGEFVMAGGTVGVLLISQRMPIGAAIDGLVRIWDESDSEEWKSRISWIPL